ncbi:MAG: nuclear transport factor 2 family protein [Dehalococcoidales bacterium]|nr:nuclear transport factor 2 family protein [Dehalococcoidales bacterium]
MSDKSLEAKVKTMESEIRSLKKQMQRLEDIEAIKRLQCAYGFYLEHWMGDEIIDCFAKDNPEVSGTFVEGTYKGPEGIRRYFRGMKEAPPEFLHMVMQVSPVITVAEDRQTAHGRWYGYGGILSHATVPLDPAIMAVIYEMDYIKEDGVWKILKLRLLMHYAYTSGRTPPEPPPDSKEAPRERPKLTPDEWAEYDTQYPSGYIYPFHYLHPVTGKPSTEAKRNAGLKLKPSPFKSRG